MTHSHLIHLVVCLYLVGGFKHFLFSPIVGMMIRSDIHIFQRGRYTTNQLFHFRENSVGNDALSSSGALFKGPRWGMPLKSSCCDAKVGFADVHARYPLSRSRRGKIQGKVDVFGFPLYTILRWLFYDKWYPHWYPYYKLFIISMKPSILRATKPGEAPRASTRSWRLFSPFRSPSALSALRGGEVTLSLSHLRVDGIRIIWTSKHPHYMMEYV